MQKIITMDKEERDKIVELSFRVFGLAMMGADLEQIKRIVGWNWIEVPFEYDIVFDKDLDGVGMYLFEGWSK